ncbi:MAG: hypothetical protein ACYCT0_11230 [Sulfobacillus sp.]
MTGRYLLGLAPLGETAAFFHNHTTAPVDLETLARHDDISRQARLQRPEPPACITTPIPDLWDDHVHQVMERPLFLKLFAGRTVQFRMVDIGSLVPIQPHVVYDFALMRAQSTTSWSDIFSLCLPTVAQPFDVTGGVTARGNQEIGCTLLTTDLNVMVAEARMLTDHGLQVTFTVGKTAVFCQAQAWHDRLYLKDGTHRAVGLLAQGITHMPCIVETVDTVQTTVHSVDASVLFGPHPPRLRDFLDPVHYWEHSWAMRKKIIRIIVDEFVTAWDPPHT